MQSQYIRYHHSNYEKWKMYEETIARLYCVSLPFRLFSQLSFLKNIFGACTNYIPFIFHILGLLLWFMNDEWKPSLRGKNDLSWNAITLLIWLNFSSLVMAIFIQFSFGNHGTENAFRGIAGMLVYFTQYLFMFLYNYRVFKLLSIEDVNGLLHKTCLLLLGIGYFQVLVMHNIGVSIYDRLDIFGILNSSKDLPKLCLTGIEGSTAGCIIGVFVFPILFSNILYGKKQYFIEAFLWLIPLYYTYSSTAYILAVVCIGVAFLLFIIDSNNPAKGIGLFLIIITGIAIVAILLSVTGSMNEYFVNGIKYLLFEKIRDSNNGSTVARTIPLMVNWGAFKEYPVMGVGNGLQGYFYEKYFPKQAMHMAGSDAVVFLRRSRQGIGNAGLFIPGLLSGYGLVGCFFILIFVFKCVRENIRVRGLSQNFYYAFIIASISFIIMGFQGDVCGLYFAWFMLSIPFITSKE